MRHPVLVAALAAAALCACASSEKKEEQEPSRDTFECMLRGERYVIRFADAEARMLTPSGARVILYQIPAASGVRYTNGLLELRGKGMALTLIDNGIAYGLDGCKPLMVPKQEPGVFDKLVPQRPAFP